MNESNFYFGKNVTCDVSTTEDGLIQMMEKEDKPKKQLTQKTIHNYSFVRDGQIITCFISINFLRERENVEHVE